MERIFEITPASSGPMIFILILSVILIALIALFIYIGYSSRNLTFAVSPEGLTISGGLYGRFIPREQIEAQEVKVLDLNIDQDYAPRKRTNGIGMPGYSAGWFKLKNNEKALMFVTDRSRVVYIPTDRDYSVMLSVENTEEFAGLIREW